MALLYDRQRETHGMDRWAGWVLPFALQLAKGQQVVFEVSEQSHENVGQAAEEAILLERLRSVGLAVNPTDPRVIAKGERQLREWIDQRVRAAVSQTITTTTEQMGLVGELADRIR